MKDFELDATGTLDEVLAELDRLLDQYLGHMPGSWKKRIRLAAEHMSSQAETFQITANSDGDAFVLNIDPVYEESGE